MTVEGTRKDIEVGHGRDQKEVVRKVDVTIEGRSEEIARKVLIGKMGSWTPAMNHKASDRKLCMKSTSGSERRRETSTKVHGSVFVATGSVLESSIKSFSRFLRIQKLFSKTSKAQKNFSATSVEKDFLESLSFL